VNARVARPCTKRWGPHSAKREMGSAGGARRQKPLTRSHRVRWRSRSARRRAGGGVGNRTPVQTTSEKESTRVFPLATRDCRAPILCSAPADHDRSHHRVTVRLSMTSLTCHAHPTRLRRAHRRTPRLIVLGTVAYAAAVMGCLFFTKPQALRRASFSYGYLSKPVRPR